MISAEVKAVEQVEPKVSNSSAKGRQDFTKKVKDELAARAGHQCSKCRISTSAAKRGSSGFLNLGIAAHICAASDGGPRFSAGIDASAVENGIWLCATCHHTVDEDVEGYPVEELRRLKDICEQESRIQVIKRNWDAGHCISGKTVSLKLKRDNDISVSELGIWVIFSNRNEPSHGLNYFGTTFWITDLNRKITAKVSEDSSDGAWTYIDLGNSGFHQYEAWFIGCWWDSKKKEEFMREDIYQYTYVITQENYDAFLAIRN